MQIRSGYLHGHNACIISAAKSNVASHGYPARMTRRSGLVLQQLLPPVTSAADRQSTRAFSYTLLICRRELRQNNDLPVLADGTDAERGLCSDAAWADAQRESMRKGAPQTPSRDTLMTATSTSHRCHAQRLRGGFMAHSNHVTCDQVITDKRMLRLSASHTLVQRPCT